MESTTQTNTLPSESAAASASASTAATSRAAMASAIEVSNEQQSPPLKSITKKAKDDLRKLFEGPPKWSRNKRLPKAGGDTQLDNIISKHGLKRTQAARQLRNFKDREYSHSQITMLIDPDSIFEAIKDSLSVSSDEFVLNVMEMIINPEESVASRDSVNLFKAMHEVNKVKKGVLETVDYFSKAQDNRCNELLCGLVDGYSRIASEEFPKTAAQLSSSELGFLMKKEEQLNNFLVKWRECKSSVPTASDLSDDEFGFFGCFLETCIFFEWSNSAMDSDRPDIKFPSESLVGKYALPVIYYVAGWTLSSLSLAKTIAF